MSFQARLDTIEDKSGLTPRQLVDVAASKGGASEVGMTTCNSRLRQLLSMVEDAGRVEESELLSLIQSTSCPEGHTLHVRSLTEGMLRRGHDGSLRLGRGGKEWLLEAGRPPSMWAESAPPNTPELHTWQALALNAWAEHGRWGVIEAVTGTGKSRVGVEATREALADDYDVVIVVPTTTLVQQWLGTLRKAGIHSVGALGGGERAHLGHCRVLVSTIQSLYLDPPVRADGKVLLVADECHRYGAAQWMRALHPSYRRRLGLTATFERNDDGIRTLKRYFGGEPVFRIGFPQAIQDDVVAHYEVKLLGVDLTPREQAEYDEATEQATDARTQLLAADFPAEPFGAFMTAVQEAADDDLDPTIQEVARRYLKAFSKRIDVMASATEKLEAMRRLAPAVKASRGALVFTRRVDAADELAQALRDEGVRAQSVHSKHSQAERGERLTALKIGRLDALVAPTILDEGLDVPDIDLGIVMSGSKSRRQMIQRMGRVLRRKEDGRKATFIVVYANGTAEDLSVGDGQEGALDLVVESADRVVTLAWQGERLIERETHRQNQSVRMPSGAALTSSINEPVRLVDAVDVATPRRDSSRLPRTLAGIEPSVVHVTQQACAKYAHANRVPEAVADTALRNLLDYLLLRGRIYLRDMPANTFAVRDDDVELTVTRERLLDYERYAPDPLADESVDETDGEETTADGHGELSESEVVVLNQLIPATIQIDGEALEMICEVFHLGDLRLSDALREARLLLGSDLGSGAAIEAVDDGFVLQGKVVAWKFDSEVARVVAVEGERELALDEAEADRPPDVRQDPADETTKAHPAGKSNEHAHDGQRTLDSSDLVNQLERLGTLHAKNLLTDGEFSAAKARLLF